VRAHHGAYREPVLRRPQTEIRGHIIIWCPVNLVNLVGLCTTNKMGRQSSVPPKKNKWRWHVVVWITNIFSMNRKPNLLAFLVHDILLKRDTFCMIFLSFRLLQSVEGWGLSLTKLTACSLYKDCSTYKSFFSGLHRQKGIYRFVFGLVSG